MHLSPRSPDFPHSAILHAIVECFFRYSIRQLTWLQCAAASRWSPQNVITLSDGTRRDQFAEFHASKTRQYIDKTMASGQDIFSVMQACILLSWYFYQEGRWVEVWIFAGFQTRVAIPLRLNYPGTFSTHGNNSPGAYLAPPKDLRDLESRRRAWWMTIMFDRIASVAGWIHAVDARDLGTELPLRTTDFESEVNILFFVLFLMLMTRYPISLQSQVIRRICAPPTFSLVTRHSTLIHSSFSSKLSCYLGKLPISMSEVTLGHRQPQVKTKILSFYLGLNSLTNSFAVVFWTAFLKTSDITLVLLMQWKAVHWTLTCTWFILFRMRKPFHSRVSNALHFTYNHSATITLHNPYIDFADSQNVSTIRCVNSARCILSAYYVLSATSLDKTRLHPFVTVIENPFGIVAYLELIFHRFAGILQLLSKYSFVSSS